MIINKRCIAAFANNKPLVALATKSRLFDPSFSLSTELMLFNYITGKEYPPTTTEMKFCKILWCETKSGLYLAAGHENGVISIYEYSEDKGLVLLECKAYMSDDVTALEYLPAKSILAAGSCKGQIIFVPLTRLEAEHYSCAIPLTMNITSIAWNPKVSKILSVASADGQIKVLDIKKNTTIMTLGSKEFSEIRRIAWDPRNNTKLLANTENGYLTVFDLSNDSLSKEGSHPDPILGFSENILVSKNVIEVHRGRKIAIGDVFDCEISPKETMVALSYQNGTTEIMAIPSVRVHMPMAVIGNRIITHGGSFGLYTMKLRASKGAKSDSKRFLEMIEKWRGPREEFVDYLQETARLSSNPLQVDLSSEEVKRIFRDDYSFLKDPSVTTPRAYLYNIIEKDHGVLATIPAFLDFMILSKVFGDYSEMRRIEDPNIIAAVLLSHGIKEYGALDGSSDAKTLRSLITGNISEYMDNRVSLGEDYFETMEGIRSIINECNRIAEIYNIPLEERYKSSKVMNEYFWHNIQLGEYEKAKELLVSDPKIKYYIKTRENWRENIFPKQSGASTANRKADSEQQYSGAGVEKQFEGMGISPNKAPAREKTPGFFSTPNLPPAPGAGSFSRPQSIPKPSISPPSTNSMSAMNNTMSVNNGSYPPRPSQQQPFGHPSQQQPFGHPGQQQPFSQPTPNTNSSSIPKSIPSPPGGQQAFPGIKTGVPQFPGNKGPIQFPKSPGIPRPNNQAVNSFRPPMPTTPYNASTTPYNAPTTPYNAPTTPYNAPTASSYNAPTTPYNAHVPPSMNGTPVSRGTPLPPQFNARPEMPITPNVAFSQGMSSEPAQKSVANRSEVIKMFDDLVSAMRVKASEKNSLIIRQRKNQSLAALASYDSINKNEIPENVLYDMSALCRRMESPDERLKADVDFIANRQSECVWFRGLADLIKIVF